jgi:hypothetical protein
MVLIVDSSNSNSNNNNSYCYKKAIQYILYINIKYFDPPAGKLVFSAAKAAENTLFSCRRTINK